MSSGGAWRNGMCTSTLPTGFTMSCTNPADPTTCTSSVSPTNVTGQTQVVSQSVVDANAAAEAACKDAGGTWDIDTGCTPPETDNTMLYFVAAAAGAVILILLLKR
jgi:hypothetical protein